MKATPCDQASRSLQLRKRFFHTASLAVLWLCASLAHAQGLVYSGGPVDFGTVAIGAAPATATISFSIPAGSTGRVGGIAATANGATLSDFTINSQTCGAVIPGPATCSVKVNFTPTSRGLRSGALTVNQSNAPAIVAYLRGIGLGSQLVFSPDSASATSTVTPLSPVFYSPSSTVYDGAGNLYFNDFLNSRILEQSATGTLSNVLSLPGNIMQSLAINGAGKLYVSVPSQQAVYAIVPGVSAAPVAFPGVTFSQPSGLAVDGSGLLYIADAQQNRIVRANPDGSGATILALNGLTRPLLTPEGLALDSAGNLYIVDSGNQRVVKVTLSTLVAVPVTITGALLFNPYGIAVDASGTLYIADTGNRRILRVPPTGAAGAILTPNFSFSVPTGVVVADNGDLVVADNNNGLVRITRSVPTSPLTFSTPTPVGTPDSPDGSKFVTLQNVGNLPLQLAIPTGTAVNPSTTNPAFLISPNGTCPQLTSSSTAASGQIAPGTSCTYGVNFTPTAAGPNTGNLTLLSMPTGATSPVTSLVPLSGTGVTTADALRIVASPSPATVGQPVSITITATLAGVTAANYRGTLTLSTTDAMAIFPQGITYTFTAADAGTHTFPTGITFGQPGLFSITVKDATLQATIPITVKPALITPAITLASSINPTLAGGSTILTATLTSAGGTPTGTVTFFDGTSPIGTGSLVNGVATVATAFSTIGIHNITARYSGDAAFTPVTSTVLAQNVQDFTFVNATVPGSAVTIYPGDTATYLFALTPTGGNTFAAPVTFSATGVPAGTTLLFIPANVPAGSTATTIKMTVGVPFGFTSLYSAPPQPFHIPAPVAVAFILLPFAMIRARRRLVSLLAIVLLAGSTLGLTGCLTDKASGYFGTTPRTFPITVTATSGGISHSANVTLTVE